MPLGFRPVTSNQAEDFLNTWLARSRQLTRQFEAWRSVNERRMNEVVEAVRTPARRATQWIEDHREQINAVVAGLAAFDRGLKEIEAQWGDAGLGYLISPLGMGERLMLTLHAAPGDADELFDFLEAALADDRFVTECSEALDRAEILGDVPRAHLKHGLAHLRERDVFNAWPPLIIGLEGAFIDVAVARGVAVRDGNHIYLADDNGNRLSQKPGGVEDVAKKLGIEPADDFGDFLMKKVYGGEGNPFRHGSAREGIRERAICLAVATLGWLDAFVAPGSLELLDDAVREELVRRDEEDERSDPPTSDV